jgi:hypothetical protein
LPSPAQATYQFTLSPDDPWAQLALQGNLVKLSTQKPGVFKAIVPCFEKRDFVRLKKTWLNDIYENQVGEMIWINERREVGVFTKVNDRMVIKPGDDGPAMGRTHFGETGVPRYLRPREGSERYTLGFDYLAMKTGYAIYLECY